MEVIKQPLEDRVATYHQRQRFFAGEYVYSDVDLHKLLKGEDAYGALPAKVSQQVLRMVDKSWKAYFASLKEWHRPVHIEHGNGLGVTDAA